MKYFSHSLQVVALLVFLFWSTATAAAAVSFTGTLLNIEIDTGLSSYSGIGAGESFSGTFFYGDSSAEAGNIVTAPPFSADYRFTAPAFGGTLTVGGGVTSATESELGIGNDDDMGDDAVVLNKLYGAGATTAVTLADTWSVSATGNNRLFGIALYSLDTSLFPDTGFQAIPPALQAMDFTLFFLAEMNAAGTPIYIATGKVTTLSPVPVPAAVYLFITGGIGLLTVARLKN
ncbi:MAG TPA: hypothetical protein ENJ64_00955 [Thiotrichales bacterium]|nr:hypothetical protein [Thiotrichales bacterium]